MYSITLKHINSLIRYIKRTQPTVLDWYVRYHIGTDGVEHVIDGLVIHCDDITYVRITNHAGRYYPDLRIDKMDYTSYIKHITKGVH